MTIPLQLLWNTLEAGNNADATNMRFASMLTAEEVCEVPPASFGRRLLLVKEILAVVGAAAGASGSGVAVDGSHVLRMEGWKEIGYE